MHPESYALMAEALAMWANLTPVREARTSPSLKGRGGVVSVLDVGSLDVNGTFRPLVMTQGWQYTGLDVRPGPNVDVLADSPFDYPFFDNSFDVVMSGSTMEHVTAIWQWVPELVRVLKPGGLLAIHTHWSFPEHRYPIDCWRILPDGAMYLLEATGKLESIRVWIANEHDLMATAIKRPLIDTD